MHIHRKIIIFKFNLKNKCKYGDKCKFRHINVHEVNEILSELEDLRRENKSLKSNLKEKCLEINNLNIMHYDVTDSTVHALKKPLISSLLKNDIRFKHINNDKYASIVTRNRKKPTGPKKS